MTDTNDSLRWLKDACALLLHEGTACGSGYLLAADLVATCAHVLPSREPGSVMQAQFPWGEIPAKVERVDEANDAALLRLETRASVTPLPRAPECSNESQWLALGYPALARKRLSSKATSITIDGTVQDAMATDTRGAPSLQLFSRNLAAGLGASPHGMSGCPVLVRGAVVGHLKRIVTDPLNPESSTGPRAEWGLVYACPIRFVEELAGLQRGRSARPPQPPGAPYDRSWYVHREEEERLALAHLETPGAPVVLWGPELFGKSTLQKYLIDSLRQTDQLEDRLSEVIEVNLGSLFSQGDSSSLEALLRNFALHLLHETGGRDEWLTELEQTPLPWPLKLTSLMEDHVLNREEDRLVLAISGADAVWGLPFQNDFYGMLRSWCEQGQSAPWSRLRLLLELSTTPSLLLDGPQAKRSPWNLLQPIELRDFQLAEVETLARLYGLGWSREDLKTKLMSLVGGHPYLLRVIMHRASLLRLPLEALLKSEESLEQLFGQHLGNVVTRLEQEPKLVEAVRRLLKDSRSALPEEIYQRLRQAGLVVRKSGGYHIRYKLYEWYLRQIWQIPSNN